MLCVALAEVLVLLAALLLSTALDPMHAVDTVLDLELAQPRFAQTDDDDTRKTRSGDSAGTSGAPTLGAAGASSTPQGRTFGIGLQLGYPTALTIKYMLRADQGLVAGIGGFSGFAYDVGSFSLHVDYVFHPHVLTRGEAFVVTWYVGGGANVMIFSNARQRSFLASLNYYYYPTSLWLAARVPIGVNLAMEQQPFEIYLEAVPQVLIFPGVSFGLGAAIGARFYF